MPAAKRPPIMGVAAAALGLLVEEGDSTMTEPSVVLVVLPLEVLVAEPLMLPELAEAVTTTPLVTVVVGLWVADAEPELPLTTEEAPLTAEEPAPPTAPVAVETTLPTAEVASERMELASWALAPAARARRVMENCILKLVCGGGSTKCRC
jgi:hypothetical protein